MPKIIFFDDTMRDLLIFMNQFFDRIPFEGNFFTENKTIINRTKRQI
jgi:hypothetical protein